MQLTTDKAARKEQPIARGVLDYFGNAIAEVANVSHVGNRQHNPGEEMHWAREKSTDHADCIARHLIERGSFDDDGLRHSAKMAWRALALLQLEIEADAHKLITTERGTATEMGYENTGDKIAAGCDVTVGVDLAAEGTESQDVYTFYVSRVEQPDFDFYPSYHALQRERLSDILFDFGVSLPIVQQIIGSTTLANTQPGYVECYAYVAGPMRGYPKFNFPAFDAARDLLVSLGINVISPADIDRNAEGPNAGNQPAGDQKVYAYRDFSTLLMLAYTGSGFIAMLPGWERSTGAVAEFFVSRWLGLRIMDAKTGESLNLSTIRWEDLIITVQQYLSKQLVS